MIVYLNNYVIFYLFINFIFGYLFFEIESFVPLGRLAHTAITVDNKLYFFGGDISGYDTTEVFYLDLTKPFNVISSSWNDISTSSAIPFRSTWAAIALTNNSNDPTVYLIGGTMHNENVEDSFISLVQTFNPNSNQWDIPIIRGKEPKRQREIQAITDDLGNIYVFGGGADSLVGSETIQYFNDMIILNTNDLTWSYGTIINAPL